jgi:uncharacterized protein
LQLPDVNVLVHAGNPVATQHGAARGWLRAAGNGASTLAFPWVVLLGFIRLSTRPGIYANPLSPPQAFASVRQWLAAPSAALLHPGDGHLAAIEKLLVQAGTAGNLTTDAHIAALAIEHGATVVTFDRDFDRFPNLSVHRLS